MKCIKNIHTGEVRRVSDSLAKTRTDIGYWKYCPKKVYKRFRKGGK